MSVICEVQQGYQYNASSHDVDDRIRKDRDKADLLAEGRDYCICGPRPELKAVQAVVVWRGVRGKGEGCLLTVRGCARKGTASTGRGTNATNSRYYWHRGYGTRTRLQVLDRY